MNTRLSQRTRTGDELRSQIGGEASSVKNRSRHAVAVSSVERGVPTARYIVWLVAAAALGVAVIVFAPFFAGSPTRSEGPAGFKGQAAPVFALRDDRGTPVSLGDYRGRIVVMNLWASWCPPCRAEMPDLQRLADYGASRGVVVVGVNEGESADRARAFAESLRIRYPIWLDASQRYGRSYSALGLPTTMIVDRNGIVARAFDGPLTYEQMRKSAAEVSGI